jgi:lysozyme
MENLIRGVDVSAHQGRLQSKHWKEAAASGIRYAWGRVADGLSHLDMTIGENLQEARNAGLWVGGYLFFRASRDPIEQAHLLLSQARLLDLPLALDCEDSTDMKLPRPDVQKAVKACLDELRANDPHVIVYTAIGWWEHWMGKEACQDDLWVAHYGVAKPLIPTGFKRQGWRFWQRTPKAVIPGLPSVGVDENVWNGTEAQLQAYVNRICLPLKPPTRKEERRDRAPAWSGPKPQREV